MLYNIMLQVDAYAAACIYVYVMHMHVMCFSSGARA